jgi:hypothetical protein
MESIQILSASEYAIMVGLALLCAFVLSLRLRKFHALKTWLLSESKLCHKLIATASQNSKLGGHT